MKGQCSCGDVQYEISDSPLFIHACYCTNCQRQSGSAHALNAMIESTCVNVKSGSTEGVLMETTSGMGQVIHRCTECKIAIWSTYGALGEDFSFVRVGTLENPNAFPPDINIFTKSKLAWTQMKADIPSFEEYYDPNEVWPKDALARMYKVIEAR